MTLVNSTFHPGSFGSFQVCLRYSRFFFTCFNNEGQDLDGHGSTIVDYTQSGGVQMMAYKMQPTTACNKLWICVLINVTVIVC